MGAGLSGPPEPTLKTVKFQLLKVKGEGDCSDRAAKVVAHGELNFIFPRRQIQLFAGVPSRFGESSEVAPV